MPAGQLCRTTGPQVRKQLGPWCQTCLGEDAVQLRPPRRAAATSGFGIRLALHACAAVYCYCAD